MGPQQVLLTGIDKQSHFARVLVSSDYIMKRIAMGLDPAPLTGMPSYMELLRKQSVGAAGASPRFWMTTNYTDVSCTPDRFGWQIRGAGIKAMAEDGVLSKAGTRQVQKGDNRVEQHMGRFDDRKLRGIIKGPARLWRTS